MQYIIRDHFDSEQAEACGRVSAENPIMLIAIDGGSVSDIVAAPNLRIAKRAIEFVAGSEIVDRRGAVQ